jgi:hypothetical protein
VIVRSSFCERCSLFFVLCSSFQRSFGGCRVQLNAQRTADHSPPGRGQGWVGGWGGLQPNHTSSTPIPQPTPLSPPWRGTAPRPSRKSPINPPISPPIPRATAFHSPPGRGQGRVGIKTKNEEQRTKQPLPPFTPPSAETSAPPGSPAPSPRPSRPRSGCSVPGSVRWCRCLLPGRR